MGMNKEYEYKGYKFDVSVNDLKAPTKLNYYIVSIKGNDFDYNEVVNEEDLIDYLKYIVNIKISRYVDNVLNKLPIEEELKYLGFK